MDGKLKWAEVLRTARVDRGFTQRELARFAGVPQPTIAEIESGRREPSLSLVSGILESAGFEVHIQLRPMPRYSAVHVAQRISRIFGREASTQDLDQMEDEAFRIVLSFRDAIAKVDLTEFQSLVGDPPKLVGELRWDAFLAAVVEDECSSRHVSPPKWVDSPTESGEAVLVLVD
jgi:transcriptional regulator with XRE-family HTH domain